MMPCFGMISFEDIVLLLTDKIEKNIASSQVGNEKAKKVFIKIFARRLFETKFSLVTSLTIKIIVKNVSKKEKPKT